MRTLSQIVAIIKPEKQRRFQELSVLFKNAQKAELYLGESKTYVPKAEDGDPIAPETKTVQLRAVDVLRSLRTNRVPIYDLVLQQDVGNTKAMADVVVDGAIILPAVPATTLLYLEKEVSELIDFVTKMPTRPNDQQWRVDTDSGLAITPPVQTARTKKTEVPLIIVPATDKHPAQAKTTTDDIVVGWYTKIVQSGAISYTEQKQILERLYTLRTAVKTARETANGSTAIDLSRQMGDAIFNFVLGK